MSKQTLRSVRSASFLPAPDRAGGGLLYATLILVVLCLGGVAAAQTAPPKLSIAISESGKSIFSALLPEIVAAGQLSEAPTVTSGNGIGVLKAFCDGTGGASPDIVLTTRRMHASLTAECQKNGVEHIAQVALGRTAMILAVRADSKLTSISTRQVYLALARDVPDKDEFRRNAAVRWSDLDPALPKIDIRFHVPPRGDGERTIFNALFLEGGCRKEALIKIIFVAEQRIARCVTTRVDRVREIPDNQTVRALLEAPEGTVGVISHSDLVNAGGKLRGLAVDGIQPDRESIVERAYGFSNEYYLYAKRGQGLHGRSLALDAAVDRIIATATLERIIGPNGSLAKLGVIPFSDKSRIAQRALFTEQTGTYWGTSLVNWVASAVTGLRGLGELGSGLTGGNAPESSSAFSDLMEIAGYKTKEIQTSVSIIPSAGMTFGIVREMSEADQEYLEHRLSRDARERSGLLASMQRSIVRSVLDVSEAAGYEISKVEIEFIPLPSAKLIMEPTDPPISIEATSILRAIEQLNDRLSEVAR